MTNRLRFAILAIIAAICAAPEGASAGASPATQPGESSGRGIVFVCDASDTMIKKIGVVRRELANTLDGMRPIDKFGVIFMRDKGCAQSDTRLLLATPANKEKGKAFVAAFTPGGKTNPITAINAAFALRPQVIYLLGDHGFPDNAAVLHRIAELNKAHAVKVDSILLLDEAEPAPDDKKLFEAIAVDNRGVCNIKKLSDLE